MAGNEERGIVLYEEPQEFSGSKESKGAFTSDSEGDFIEVEQEIIDDEREERSKKAKEKLLKKLASLELERTLAELEARKRWAERLYRRRPLREASQAVGDALASLYSAGVATVGGGKSLRDYTVRPAKERMRLYFSDTSLTEPPPASYSLASPPAPIRHSERELQHIRGLAKTSSRTRTLTAPVEPPVEISSGVKYLTLPRLSRLAQAATPRSFGVLPISSARTYKARRNLNNVGAASERLRSLTVSKGKSSGTAPTYFRNKMRALRRSVTH